MPFKDPERKRQHEREKYHREKKERAEQVQKDFLSDPLKINMDEMKTANGIMSVTAEQIMILREAKGIDPITKARAIGYLVGVQAKIIESNEIERQLEELQAVVDEIKEGGRTM